MFHSKQDVDRHVKEVFKNIKSEYQRNLKCYQIAKLYYKFEDYKSAIKYINRYILTTTNSAAAHRLLGECYLGFNLKVKAIEAFKTSLVLNGTQNDLLLKICALLMDPDLSTVTPRATYWLERAETLFPTNPVVFQLREHLLKSNLEGKQDNGQLEKLILSEISARPADVTVRIRLLNFFIDTKRYKLAYQHALEIEERDTFSNDLRWYDCLCNVVQAYEKANNDLGFSFMIKKIIFLEKRSDLFMQEFQEEVKTASECSSALFAFDQNMHSLSKIEVPQEEVYFFNEFLKHMRCQLSFHLATLMLKRARKELGIWPKAYRIASVLLLQATQNTMDLEEAWYNMWPGKNKMEKEIKQLNKSATLRISQAGHVLLAWSQSKGSKFLEKVSQFYGGKWPVHVYQDIFYSREHQQAIATSHFANDSFFVHVPLRLLTEAELTHFDEVSQSMYPDSLHHMVWLGLAYCNANGQFSRDFRCTTVPDLQFTVVNLNRTGPETLNQLDVDAFLYASVLCAKSPTPSVVNTDKPSRLPVSISEELCSPAQAEWWTAVHKTYKNQSFANLADTRLKLRKGIEVIRVFGQHGLHPKIIVALAKLFQERGAKNKNPNESTGLEERAYLYWTAAIPLLEKMEKNQQLRDVPNRLFDYRGKDLSSNEIKSHLEDGRLFLARRLMKQGRHEQAIEVLQSLKGPYATFYQALIYEELASEEVNHRPESITSENRSQHIILLTRARDALYLTLDRLRCPSVDPNHPLNAQLQDHLDQIERQLAKIDPDSNLKSGDSQSDETDIVPGPLGSDVEETLENSFNIYNTNNFMGVKNQSGSRILRQNLQEKHNSIRFEARPSPERLDAQLRHLVQANCNGLQAIVEQLKEMKATMQIELKDLGCVTRDLLAEMKRYNDRLESVSKRTTDVLKPEDLFDLREEDYEDLNQLSQPYTPYPNYQVNRQMTGTQGTSTVTYGTPVPSPLPPVPPVIPTPENPLIPSAFYPGSHPVPPLDPSLLLYQSLGYYAPGIPYGENQNVSDFRGTGAQKGVPFAKNAFKVPDTVANSTALTTKLQPPNVVITSSDTLPPFTSAGTPAMSVTVPPQHIRGVTPSVAQKSSSNQVHPFQIQMPPQAHLVKESPTEKLNSLTPTTSPFKSPLQSRISNIKATPAQQASLLREITPAKTGSHMDRNNEGKVVLEQKDEENKLFMSQGKLSVFIKGWVEKGNALIKILHDEKAGEVRIVAYRESSSLIYAAHLITPEVSIKPLAENEKGWVWSAENWEKTDLKPHEMSMRTYMNHLKFRVQFDTLDEARDFEYAFNEGRRISKESNRDEVQKSMNLTDAETTRCKTCKEKAEGAAEQCSACLSKEKSTEKANLGGFTFASSPIVKAPVLKLNEEKEKPKQTPKPSPFAEFSFSTARTTPSKTDTQPKLVTAAAFTSQNTTSPNWFAGVKADPNSFKKDANFKDFEGKGSLVFGYLNKNKTPTPKTNKNEGGDDGEEEFVPTAEFTPVVDLPDLVDIKTGEENDKVLYDERAKLLRFDINLKEWKERGVGGMRVLLNHENGKVRLLMRRELIFKVCCNHYLDEKMEFVRMTKSERALTWYAHDYSDGNIKAEFFALKFADPESMKRFETAIRKAQEQMENGRIKSVKALESLKESGEEEKPKELKPLSELIKPKVDSWECSTCLIRNNETAQKCIACETPKPGTETSTTGSNSQISGFGEGIFARSSVKFTFGIPQSTTAPTTIPGFISTSKSFFSRPQSTTTTTSFSSGSLQSSAGSTAAGAPATNFIFGNPQSAATVSNPSSTKVSLEATTPAPNYTFGIPKAGVTSTDNVPVSTSAGTFTSAKNQSFPFFGALTSSGSTGFTFSMSLGAPVTGVSSAGNVPVSTSAAIFTSSGAQDTPSTAASGFTGFTPNTYGVSKPGVTTAGSVPFVSPVSTAQPASSAGIFTPAITHSFTFTTPSADATKNTFSPFTVPVSKAEDKFNTESSAPRWTVPTSTSGLKTEGKEVFGFSLGNTTLANMKVSPQKTKSSSPKRKASAEGATSGESGGEEDADGSKEAEEDNIIVKPIIPLPEKVAPHTGEEDEDVIYEQRAKLFRFIDKEWKERGIGAVKILKHRTHNKIRVLMRRETILKVCLNHYLTPDIEFKPMDDKTWTWAAADFSDGEVQGYLFAIRFKTPEIAREFKKALDDVQNNSTPPSSKEEKAKESSADSRPLEFASPNMAESEPPASSQSNKSDDDLLVVYENKVTPEQRQKAISLHLPPNFYAYLQAPDCPGCPGCDKEDAPVQTEQTPAPVTTSNTIFGNKPWGTLNFGEDDSSQKKILFTFAGNQGTPTWNAGLTAQKLTPARKIENEKENEAEDEDEEEEEDEDFDDEEEYEDNKNEDAEDEDLQEEEDEDNKNEDAEDEDLQEEEDEDNKNEDVEEEDEDNENDDVEDEDYGEGEGQEE